jgi:hypothetical protein
MGVSGQRHAPATLYPRGKDHRYPVPGTRYPVPGTRYPVPGTHWIGGWVGLRAGLDAGARIKILCPCRGSNLDHLIVQSVVRHFTA